MNHHSFLLVSLLLRLNILFGLMSILNYAFFFHLPTSKPLSRLMEEPAAYGKLGLANLLELREECLREFQFVDAYRSIKQR